jgi:hypothetical protein
MVAAADQELPGRLLLEMASNAEVVVALSEHFGIHRAVRIVTDGAAFAHRFVFKHERPALGGVALAASVPFERQRSSTVDGITFMGVVAIAATDPAFDNRMMRRQVKLASLIQMTLEARLRIPARVDDGVASASAFGMKTAGTVARFTTNLGRVRPRRLQAGMRGCPEIARNVLVALAAIVGSNEGGSRDCGGRDDNSFQSGAGDNADRQQHHENKGG